MFQLWRKLRPACIFLTFRQPAQPVQFAQHDQHLLSYRLMKRCSFLALIALGILLPASAQTTVFNCPSFSSAGDCAVGDTGSAQEGFIIRNGGYLSGDQINFVPANSIHNGYGLSYYAPVNIDSFSTTFAFIPNGQNIAFVVQNTSNTPGYEGNVFSSGAGCEGGFYQAFNTGTVPSPNNLFALEFDSGSWLTEASEAFTYSSVQTYQSNQSPCLPNDSGPNYVPISKISTSPVTLNSPSDAAYTTTGHVYSATVTYNGTTLTLSMHDETAGGSCPGSTCFTHSWNVNIASIVGGPTAYIGFTAGINIPNLPTLHVTSWTYSDGSSSSSAKASTPTFSPGPGQYTAAQSVQIATTTSKSTVYYTTNGATPTTSSNKYSAPVTVGSSETLRAVAVAKGVADSYIGSAYYTVNSNPSSGSAEVINFANGFASHPNLWLGNSAAYSGSSLELTVAQDNLANNVWFTVPVNVQNFTTTFTWTATCPAKPASCGDGMGFMIIGKSNPSSAGYNYSGSDGSNLGWSKCTSATCPAIKSVFVKFDLYNNSTTSDGANLTGFYSGGVSPQRPSPEYDMSPSGINIESGHLMKATLAFNGSVLTEAVTDTVTGATYRNSYSENIPSLVGGDTAYVGFGGSSGAARVLQNIKSWTYTVE